jgi:ClpX C4-type zinc finger protein
MLNPPCISCGRIDPTKVISGPSVGVCLECHVQIRFSLEAVPHGGWISFAPGLERPHECSFCGRESEVLAAVAACGGGSICKDCVELCTMIFTGRGRLTSA